MSKRTQQQGMGILGLLFTLGVIAMLTILVLKLTPVYIEYFKVRQAVAAIAQRGITTPTEVRSAFEKQANIDLVTSVTARDIAISGSTLSFAYDKKIPLFANISLYIEFKGSSTAAGGRY